MATTPGYVRPSFLDSDFYIKVFDRSDLPESGSEIGWVDIPPSIVGTSGGNYFHATYYDDGGGRPANRPQYLYASWQAPNLSSGVGMRSDTTEGYSIVRTFPGETHEKAYQCTGSYQDWLHGGGDWLDYDLGTEGRGFRGGSQFHVPLWGYTEIPGSASAPDYIPEYFKATAVQEIFIPNPDAPESPPNPPYHPPPTVGECPRPPWPYRPPHIVAGGNNAAIFRFK